MSFPQGVYFLSSFTAFFLNWRINQHHYYREMRTILSELHLNYPQLCLLSLVWGVEPHVSIFSLKLFLRFDYQKCLVFSQTT